MKDKHKRLITEMLSYCVAGGSAFLCDLGTKTRFHSVLLPESMGGFEVFGFAIEWRVAVSTAAGFVVGLLVNYIISILYVFTNEKQKEQGRGIKAFLIYFCVSIVGLLINFVITQLGCNIFGITRDDTFKFLVVSCIAAGIALIWNYIGRKAFVYRGK